MDVEREIIQLWTQVNRTGIYRLIDFLQKSDFFRAPCSTKFHLAEPGGLARHSLNVYWLLREKVQRYNINVAEESVIVCGLGHDLCKVNFYVPKMHAKEYEVNDLFPLGHGEKSVSILQDFIPLTPVEKLAIRWHMTAFDAGIHFDYPSGHAFRKASNLHPLVPLLFTADYEASQVVELLGLDVNELGERRYARA